MKYSTQLINDFVAQFKPAPNPNVKKKKPCRIKVNGNFVSFGAKNKTVWKCKRDAKSAFTCHFECGSNILIDQNKTPVSSYLLGGKVRHYFYSREESAAWKDFVDFLQKEGILEFVEIDE